MKSSKKSLKLFDSRVFRVIISVLTAFLIWMYFTSTQEEEIELVFNNVKVVFSGAEAMQSSKGFVVTEADTKSVSVLITGTRQNIGKLDSSDLQAVIDLSQVTRAGNNRVSYKIVFPDSVDSTAVTVKSKTPEFIQFFVAKLSTKTVPVKGTLWEAPRRLCCRSP
jgi:YbbR domain-containing protein